MRKSRTHGTGQTPQRTGWIRLGLAAAIGFLAGTTLFARPARGRAGERG